jgi:ATPase subunit of ABC transporter with duplicated ATPase domains
MAQQYIFQMERLTKRLDDGRELLSEFWLSFYPGAKIGIIGQNGAGKSTILRIMAGVDKDFEGRTWMDPEGRLVAARARTGCFFECASKCRIGSCQLTKSFD